MTPGVDGETLDGFSREWVKKTIDALKSRKFQFKPSFLYLRLMEN